MRRLTGVLAVVLLAAFAATGYAARDSAPAPAGKPLTQRETNTRLEVLVFEIEGCALCDVFRRDIAPQYQAGSVASRVPMRFIDINKTDPETLALRAHLSQVPTVVLMQDGREFDRITGYVGPTNFFRMLDALLTRVE
jgi:thioredoxin-related protein